MTSSKVLRIDALRDRVAGRIELRGQTHDVLQPTLRAQQALLAGGESPTEIAQTLDLVRAVVPTLSDDDLASLNVDQAVAILTLANSNIEAVEKAFPNAVSPATA